MAFWFRILHNSLPKLNDTDIVRLRTVPWSEKRSGVRGTERVRDAGWIKLNKLIRAALQFYFLSDIYFDHTIMSLEWAMCAIYIYYTNYKIYFDTEKKHTYHYASIKYSMGHKINYRCTFEIGTNSSSCLSCHVVSCCCIRILLLIPAIRIYQL